MFLVKQTSKVIFLLLAIVFISASASYSSQGTLRVPIQRETAARALATAKNLSGVTYYNPVPGSFGIPRVVNFSGLAPETLEGLLKKLFALEEDSILLIESSIPASFFSRLKQDNGNIKGLVVLNNNIGTNDIDSIQGLSMPVIGLKSMEELTKYENSGTLIVASDGVKAIRAGTAEFKNTFETIAQVLVTFKDVIESVSFFTNGGMQFKMRKPGTGITSYNIFERKDNGSRARMIYCDAVRSIGKAVTIRISDSISKERIEQLLRERIGIAGRAVADNPANPDTLSPLKGGRNFEQKLAITALEESI